MASTLESSPDELCAGTPATAFSLGDPVEVRDSDAQAWKRATVTRLEGAILATLDGCQQGYRWKQIRTPLAPPPPEPKLTWAERAARNAAATKASSSTAAPGSSGTGAVASRAPVRQPCILDYYVHLAKRKQNGLGAANPVPTELEKFQGIVETSSVKNTGKAEYCRLGMRNDANNCYLNVVVQALLQCSALRWICSHCTPNDSMRPFYGCFTRIFKEFTDRKPEAHGSAVVNVLALPQIKELISTWQRFGAQQDAGEFLFYMLSCMHEECNWAPVDDEPSSPSVEDTGTEEEESSGAWAHLVKGGQRKVESRSAGLKEDSPIVRIFGGMLHSIVRAKSARADSMSCEPFNHLDLDISQPGVNSVRTALDAFCKPESVNDGQATRRMAFKTLPKVLILNLKRFTYNRGKAEKITKAIRYDEKLTFDQSWLADDVRPLEYWITAVICHIGDSANGGHYNVIVRYNKEWFLYDDTVIRQVDMREVGSQHCSAYLLVYQSHGEVDLRP